MLYIAAIPWLHLGKGKWKCQFTSAVTNGTTPFVFAESATEEESRKHVPSSRLKKPRQRFAKRFTTVSTENRLAKRALLSSLKRSTNLGRRRTNALSIQTTNTNSP